MNELRVKVMIQGIILRKSRAGFRIVSEVSHDSLLVDLNAK